MGRAAAPRGEPLPLRGVPFCGGAAGRERIDLNGWMFEAEWPGKGYKPDIQEKQQTLYRKPGYKNPFE